MSCIDTSSGISVDFVTGADGEWQDQGGWYSVLTILSGAALYPGAGLPALCNSYPHRLSAARDPWS